MRVDGRRGTEAVIRPAVRHRATQVDARRAAMQVAVRRKATLVVTRKVVAAGPQAKETAVAAVAGHRISTADRTTGPSGQDK
jgi:hypothetical protein